MNRFGCSVVAPFPWQPTRDGLRGLGASSSVTGSEKGATTGASVGSAIPVIGTAVGAILGAIGGAIAGSLNKTDPEQHNFDQAVAMWQVNPNSVFNIANKYLPLAGLFDLKKVGGNIPIYKRYGRMGEQRFVTDLVNQVYTAAQQGRIHPNDTPLSIKANIVQPWIDSWGYGPLQDTHADLIDKLITGMVADYITGAYKNWTAVGGDFPFSNLPPFSLPQAAAPAPAPAPMPSQMPVPVVPVNPVGSAPASSPGQMTAIAGTTLNANTNASMATPYGLFSSWVGGGFTFQAPGSAAVQIAVAPATSSSPGTLSIEWTGNQVLAHNNDASLWSFDPATHQFVQVTPAQSMVAIGNPLPSVNPVGTTPLAPTVPATIPQVTTTAPSPTIATTSAGQQVTQADLQAMIAQLAAQGQTAQQAYQSAIQALQNNGVQATPQVQGAVQSAVESTPAPVAAGVTGDNTPGWLVPAAILGVLFATARPAPGSTRRRRRVK